MAKDAGILIAGVILECKPGATFIVKTERDTTVMAHLSGKMKMNFIKVTPGDQVQLELSPYDLGRGRIIRRN
jgi:translation initiation factor IF-1